MSRARFAMKKEVTADTAITVRVHQTAFVSSLIHVFNKNDQSAAKGLISPVNIPSAGGAISGGRWLAEYPIQTARRREVIPAAIANRVTRFREAAGGPRRSWIP